MCCGEVNPFQITDVLPVQDLRSTEVYLVYLGPIIKLSVVFLGDASLEAELRTAYVTTVHNTRNGKQFNEDSAQ